VPTRCAICFHENRRDIERDMREGKLSYRAIGAKYGFSTSPVQSHKRHMTDSISLPTTPKLITAADTDTLCEEITTLKERAYGILNKAEKADHLSVAISAVREIRGVLELLGKISGDVRTRTVSIHLNPQWIQIRGAVVTALRPYPDALEAFTTAIDDIGGANVSDITE